jgi:PadR family transcriptional regulator PadR
MSGKNPRMTMAILDILDAVISAPPDSPAWGLKLCEETGYGTSTVYPALDRLMKARWIADRWEEPAPADRPRRRYYEITEEGRATYEQAMRERATRQAARRGNRNAEDH